MASMTDFIDSINVADVPSVYNEDYSWAEEYSEYFNDASDNYIQPILESSGYQFFGEATFYQEAHKGLIAGGILALVSGAFFMIMKLLRNGNNGKSSSSNKSETKADKLEKKLKENSEKLKKKNREEEEREADAEFERSLKKAERERDNARREAEQAKKERDELKRKVEETNKPESVKLPELPDMNDFDIENRINGHIKYFKKLKKAGLKEQIKLPSGWLSNHIYLRTALYEIEGVVDYMCSFINERIFVVFTKSQTPSKLRETFEEKINTLDRAVINAQRLATFQPDLTGPKDEQSIDGIIAMLRSISDLIVSIRDKCKEGMNKCKQVREDEKTKAEEIKHIDNAYKELNSIVKDVKYVADLLLNSTSKLSLCLQKYRLAASSTDPTKLEAVKY